MNRTFIICKPDAVERNLVGEILGRFEAKGLRLVAAELRVIDVETSRRHYAEHVEKGFYAELEDFITRGPSLLAVLEGPTDTWAMVRSMMGATNPADAAPGTIRKELAESIEANTVHGSDSDENAAIEIAYFFKPEEIVG